MQFEVLSENTLKLGEDVISLDFASLLDMLKIRQILLFFFLETQMDAELKDRLANDLHVLKSCSGSRCSGLMDDQTRLRRSLLNVVHVWFEYICQNKKKTRTTKEEIAKKMFNTEDDSREEEETHVKSQTTWREFCKDNYDSVRCFDNKVRFSELAKMYHASK